MAKVKSFTNRSLGRYRTDKYLRNNPLDQHRTDGVLKHRYLCRLRTGRGGRSGRQAGTQISVIVGCWVMKQAPLHS